MSPFLLLLTAVSAVSAQAQQQQQQQQSQSQQIGQSSSSAQSSSSETALYSEYGVLEFDNFGFEGYFKHVKTLDDSSSCNCELASNSDRTVFSGSNSPLDGEVSVHFRGPLSLSQFAYYVSSNESSSSWERKSYYDSSSQTSENVTFLTAAGDNSTCLGNALTYADTDGITESSSSNILSSSNKIASDDEFIIYSNISCESSGFKKDCGVYRSGIPAYHGFYGTTKLFLFEFTMPEETSDDEDSFEFYNLPAIWLLNAYIPRTSQYPTNENCSCWATGCGEFDIFEVMNTTEAHHLYSTIHDYQGTGDIGTGIQAPGYIYRDYSATIKGGVVFDSTGKATVFVSNDTSIDSSIEDTNLRSWISGSVQEDSAATSSLVSATNTGSGKVNAAAPSLMMFNFDIRYVWALFAVVGAMAFL